MDKLIPFFYIPFLEGGRSYDGCDCWGFIYLFYKDILNIILPSYTQEDNSKRDLFIKVKAEDLKDYDIALMSSKDFNLHAGLVYKNYIYHMDKRGLRANSLKVLSPRIQNFYRVKNDKIN